MFFIAWKFAFPVPERNKAIPVPTAVGFNF
jgi:hypothetical protein